MTDVSRHGDDRSGRRGVEPDDARRGLIAPLPRDADEAAADRELAAAERSRAQGRASEEQQRKLDAVADARSPEERRRRWMGAG